MQFDDELAELELQEKQDAQVAARVAAGVHSISDSDSDSSVLIEESSLGHRWPGNSANTQRRPPDGGGATNAHIDVGSSPDLFGEDSDSDIIVTTTNNPRSVYDLTTDEECCLLDSDTEDINTKRHPSFHAESSLPSSKQEHSHKKPSKGKRNSGTALSRTGHVVSDSSSEGEEDRNTNVKAKTNTASSSFRNEERKISKNTVDHNSKQKPLKTLKRKSSAESDDSDRTVDLEDDVSGNVEDARPVCKYGTKCYRKNPSHLEQFRHPG